MHGSGTKTANTNTEFEAAPQVAAPRATLWSDYKLRWKRRRYLWRSFRSRHDLSVSLDRTAGIKPDDIIAVMVIRNEIGRLPYFFQHYRRLGVGHFLIVDNASDDGSRAFLADQQDVSIWSTPASYRASRFGLDWMTWLQMRFAHRRWCLMVDADELLVYDGIEQHTLPDLTAMLDDTGQTAFGAHMLDLYPRGALGEGTYDGDQNPFGLLEWFDPGPYRAQRQFPANNLWVQGGMRERAFFQTAPHRSPTLNKLPLVKWHRRFAYMNSCHSILPKRLNALYDGPGDSRPSGVLLHTKFLPSVIAKSNEDLMRRQHFNQPDDFAGYYAEIAAQPVVWTEQSRRYDTPSTLIEAGLMPKIAWF